MRDFELYDRVAARLLGADRATIVDCAKATNLSEKTLGRLAAKANDARFGTLVAVEKYFRSKSPTKAGRKTSGHGSNEALS